MRERLLVIGGTAAGLSAASKANREGAFDITIIERTGFTSYGSCGLPYYVGKTIEEHTELISLTPEDLTNKRGMRVLLHCEATEIDRNKKAVKVRNLITGETLEVEYDKLVIATGASPIIPANIPGVSLKGVLSLRTVEDGIALRERLEEGRVCVIGGGYIGLELAAELREIGIDVVVVEKMPKILPFLKDEYSNLIEDTLANHGVKLLAGTELLGICGENGQVSAIETSSGRIECSTVVMCIGARPNSELAANAGLWLGIKNAIAVNESLMTSDDSIWACGDCIETYHLITGQPIYMPLGTHANKQGKAVGSAIAGKKSKDPGVLGTQITKVFEKYIACTGLTIDQAKEAGFDPVEAAITKNDRASYYPGGSQCWISLIADRKTGRLLGGQIVGGESAAGRINTIAAALLGGLTVEQICGLDLAYAPPVAPVYDPIIVAAEQLQKKL